MSYYFEFVDDQIKDMAGDLKNGNPVLATTVMINEEEALELAKKHRLHCYFWTAMQRFEFRTEPFVLEEGMIGNIVR